MREFSLQAEACASEVSYELALATIGSKGNFLSGACRNEFTEEKLFGYRQCIDT